MNRVVIFTGDVSAFSVRWGIGELANLFPEIRWLIVEHRPIRRWKSVASSQWRQFRREGVRWIWHVPTAIARAILRSITHETGSSAATLAREYELPTLLKRKGISLIRSGDIHSPEAIAGIRRFDPELGISLAAPILRREVFAIPPLGTINLHKGKLPDFRGMPPAFWEIWTGAKEVGCSIHRVESGLDAGPILLRTTIPVEPFSTVRGLQIRLDHLGVEMMCDAVRLIAEGPVHWEVQTSTGKTFRKPTLAQLAEAHTREPGRVPFNWRVAAKEMFFLTYVVFGRSLPRFLLGLIGRQRITVILYHRVSDQMRDSLTVGVEQFERQMIETVKHCQVVSIDDIVRNRVSRRAMRPIVAVTFDDGYRDNYELAAPVLLRQGIPAGFFVSTALLENDRGFPHDLEKLGRAIPSMDWRQVAQLRRWGFVIGSHTETHINCAKADAQAVDREIVESRKTLCERVGLDNVIFAYPYGGRGDFNDYWRERVRQAGYIGCLAAYGGRNKPQVDAFDVQRTGINHGFGKWSFRARLEGWA